MVKYYFQIVTHMFPIHHYTTPIGVLYFTSRRIAVDDMRFYHFVNIRVIH